MATRGRPISWTQERALDAIADFVLREKRLPGRADWGGGTLPSLPTVKRLFGTERGAVVALLLRALN